MFVSELVVRIPSAILAPALLLCALAQSADAQLFTATDRFGLWVIGPDRATRRWASEWIETALRTTPRRPELPILPWRDVLNELLDGHDGETELGPRPPGGPFVGPLQDKAWPWNMCVEVPLSDMIDIVQFAPMGVVVQVVVRKEKFDESPSSDSVYILSALALARGTSGATSRLPVVRTSVSRAVVASTLQEASVKLGVQIASIWADLVASGSARAR